MFRFRSTTLLMALALVLFAGESQARKDAYIPGTYTIDNAHTRVSFVIPHLVIAKVEGRFNEVSGEVVAAEKFRDSKVTATIPVKSIDTGIQQRDDHLRSADFFEVEKYPTMTYKMKSYSKAGDGYSAIGDLMLHGVTKEVTLTGNFNGVTKDPWGNTRAGFTAEGKLNRKDFGMVWNKALDSGGLVVGDEVWIKLDIECIKAKS